MGGYNEGVLNMGGEKFQKKNFSRTSTVQIAHVSIITGFRDRQRSRILSTVVRAIGVLG